MDQKIEILEIIFRHIFTKEPGKPMFLGTLNTMSAIILAKLQSFGAKISFSISIAPDTHLRISSLFFIAILLLYSVQFFSFELLNAFHISTKTFLSSSFTFLLPYSSDARRRFIPKSAAAWQKNRRRRRSAAWPHTTLTIRSQQL